MSNDLENKIRKRDKAMEHWFNSRWRPAIGWMYMIVCIMDFVVFPILWSLLQAIMHGNVQSQWQPLTLQGGGLFHIAMGGVIGVNAYGRTKEKLGGVANPIMASQSNINGFSSAATAPVVTSGFAGKSAPVQTAQPML